ncbi:hypothetical protein MIR68_001398 [Amoeboaphelidium protococcarum]|nr:hypothetical protein MIR68_001398 [Amoeboaphelidium protococcarum]
MAKGTADAIAPFIIVGLVCVVGYYVLSWVQRRNLQVSIPNVKQGQWDPVVANYTWSSSVNNKHKEEYIRLKQLADQQQQSQQNGQSPATARNTLAQALMRRTMHNVQQLMDMQSQKQSLSQLVKQGLIGEDVMHRFQMAEQVLNEDCGEIVQEANQLKPQWGESIFQDAAKLIQIEKQREQEMQMKEMEQDMAERRRLASELSEEDRRLKDQRARQAAEELLQLEEQERAKGGGNKKTSPPTVKKRK